MLKGRYSHIKLEPDTYAITSLIQFTVTQATLILFVRPNSVIHTIARNHYYGILITISHDVGLLWDTLNTVFKTTWFETAVVKEQKKTVLSTIQPTTLIYHTYCIQDVIECDIYLESLVFLLVKKEFHIIIWHQRKEFIVLFSYNVRLLCCDIWNQHR